ncbi:MAG: N-6 DNA methylase [Planctomycetes bacterium]|nr:N-6 DNA methylase [Planctomycetota bacterium]
MPTLQSNADPQPFAKRLAGYGCTEIIRLDEKLSEPEQLDYLDLLPARSNHTPTLTAVAEHQGTALLYLVDACGKTKCDAASHAAVRRRLANRSDPAWLGVVRAGSLEIFPIGFHEVADTQPVKTIEQHSETAPFFFQSLVHGTFEENSTLHGTDYVYRKIFELLTQTTDRFVPPDGKGQIDAIEVLSMAGRALFFRFLIDRDIVRKGELSGPDGICPAATELKDTFSTAEKAAQTSAWLDATFNGDFLPLIDESIPLDDRATREAAYLRFYEHTQDLVGEEIFQHLHAILHGWRAVGGDFQTEFDWGDLDFAHIPVGVLSQVYESFSHRADPRTARDTSVHYTPRTIARLMVDEAFAAVKNPADAKVLDSSCGAGIFLVLAFRRLVRERWLGDKDQERPKTAAIQDILYNQLRGFDISEPALRLAALALYITAIELNASPHPPKALKFPRNLRGEVLHRFSDQDEAGNKPAVFPLGSLGPEVPREFDKTFDIVIGNPPWTRLRDRTADGEDDAGKRERKSAITAVNAQFTKIGRRVLEERGVDDLPKRYQNPDNNPDLPFLWRAMEWAKPDGVIALAMPARLFGRTTGLGFEAWRAILRSVEVTGLINGADLRKTAVWEGVDMPFCVFFARNRVPGADYRFHYSAPSYEPDLNGGGRFRIDYEVAHPISAGRVEEQPWLLKTLSLGTWLDAELMEPLSNPVNKTLDDRWVTWDAARKRTGQGYNRSPNLRQEPKGFLADLPVFEKPKDGFSVNYEVLNKYGDLFGTNSEGQSSAHMPRREELYQPPLVIVPKAPGEDPYSPKAYLSDRALAFSQSYYGYSCSGHPEEQTLAALVYLLAHSTLFRYFALMVSVSQGADHMIFTKRDFDALPFPDIETLPGATKSTIRSLAKRLQHNATKPWQEMNEFIFKLYGLDADAVQVAEDTLFAATSYRRAGRAALDCTTRDTRVDFVTTLHESLEPYFDVCGEHVAVREAEFQPDTWREPWFFLSISREAETVNVNPSLMREAMKAANQHGCSRIIVRAPRKRGLLLGLLNQRRWWTITRARLCAQHIIRERLGACGLPEDA